MRKRKYMNPYLAGCLLSTALLAAMYFSGRGLGASGGIKYTVVSAVQLVNTNHVEHSSYYNK